MVHPQQNETGIAKISSVILIANLVSANVLTDSISSITFLLVPSFVDYWKGT